MERRFVRIAAAVTTICLFAALLAPCGCGSQTGQKRLETHPVVGKVLVNGVPKEGIRITFHPQFETGEMKVFPNGVSGADGEFSLGSYKAGDGAPAGKYAVTVDWPIAENEDGDAFGGNYSSAKKPFMEITVRAGENRLPPFKLHLSGKAP